MEDLLETSFSRKLGGVNPNVWRSILLGVPAILRFETGNCFMLHLLNQEPRILVAWLETLYVLHPKLTSFELLFLHSIFGKVFPGIIDIIGLRCASRSKQSPSRLLARCPSGHAPFQNLFKICSHSLTTALIVGDRPCDVLSVSCKDLDFKLQNFTRNLARWHCGWVYWGWVQLLQLTIPGPRAGGYNTHSKTTGLDWMVSVFVSTVKPPLWPQR